MCHSLPRRLLALSGVLGMMTCMCVTSVAQGPGVSGGQGRGQGGRQGGGRQASVATMPVERLSAILNLTPAQKTKIGQIQGRFAKEMQSLRPQQGQGFNRESMQKMRDLNTRTGSEIEAVLTTAQKAKLETARREMRLYRMAGIPMGLYGQIKLTADQKAKLQALMPRGGPGGGRGPGGPGGPPGQPGQRGGGGGFGDFQEIRTKAAAILTPVQKTQIASYLKAHPAEQRGGRGGGGFGGGRQRGQGGGQ